MSGFSTATNLSHPAIGTLQASQRTRPVGDRPLPPLTRPWGSRDWAATYIGPQPGTVRGAAVQIGKHPKLPKIIYPSGKYIIVRDLVVCSHANRPDSPLVPGKGVQLGPNSASNPSRASCCQEPVDLLLLDCHQFLKADPFLLQHLLPHTHTEPGGLLRVPRPQLQHLGGQVLAQWILGGFWRWVAQVLSDAP